jgi:WD40 repeat protein
VVFLPDGRRALSGASDKTVRLWDLETGKELRRFVGHTVEVTWVALAPDGTRFASCSGDRSVRVWDVESDRALRVLPGHPGPLTCVAFSPDGRRLIAVGSFPEALIWDWEGGTVMNRVGVPNGCWCAAFGPGGGSFAVTPGALIWLFAGNDPTPRVFKGHTLDVHGLAISPSGTLIASSSFDGTVRLWDVAQGREVRRLKEHVGVVNCVAFSPDGRRLISAGSADRVLRLWEIDTGRQLRRMEGHDGNLPCVAISPDGRYALSGGDDSNLVLWKLPE